MENEENSNSLIVKPLNYWGRIPACGVFCGGCPVYVRDKKPCPGADVNRNKCENCKTFHLCCQRRGITHCYECSAFPCYKFKAFARSWLKYGQNFIENQVLLKKVGDNDFLKHFNSKVEYEQEID